MKPKELSDKLQNIEPLLGIISDNESLTRLRIALIYNYTIEHTTGQYVRKVLEKCLFVTVYHPKDIHIIENNFDLYLVVDDGSHYIFPRRLKPSAIWLIDTHLTFTADIVMALNFDYIFTAQKLGAQKFLHFGFSNVYWLPLACDPQIHAGLLLEKKYDIGFVGNLGYGPRSLLLETVKNKYCNSYIGNAKFYEMATIYSQSVIVFNKSINCDLNMRVFEGMCSGSILLTDNVGSIDELFIDNEHLLLYDSDDCAINKIDSILNGAFDIAKIANTGANYVKEYHTYTNRVNAILIVIKNNNKSSRKLSIIFDIISRVVPLQILLIRTYINIMFLFWVDISSSKIFIVKDIKKRISKWKCYNDQL